MRFALLIEVSPADPAIAAFHEELARAGVLLEAAAPNGRPAGRTLIDVRSRDEALEWARRLASQTDARIELQPLTETETAKGPAMKKTLHFTIDIDAPRRSVWHAMIDPQPYAEWTAAFCEGSTYEGRWEAGQRVRFLSPSGEGMVGEIAEHRPYEFTSIRHLGEVKPGGVEDTTSESVRAWAPAYENYTFSTLGEDRTRVQVDLDVLPSYEAFMQETFPKALARLKAVAERDRA